MLILYGLTLVVLLPTTLGDIEVFDKQISKYPTCGQADFQDVSRGHALHKYC